MRTFVYRGRILGRNWDKSLEIFPTCYSQINPPLSESGLKLVCKTSSLRTCLCPETSTKLYVEEFCFSILSGLSCLFVFLLLAHHLFFWGGGDRYILLQSSTDCVRS